MYKKKEYLQWLQSKFLHLEAHKQEIDCVGPQKSQSVRPSLGGEAFPNTNFQPDIESKTEQVKKQK